MLRLFLIVPSVVLLSVGPIADAQTIGSPLLSLGLRAGTTLPANEITRLVNRSTMLMGVLATTRSPAGWLRFRLDAEYERFAARSVQIFHATGTPVGHVVENTSVLTGMAGAEVRATKSRALRPYAFAGIGAARFRGRWRMTSPAGKESGLGEPVWTRTSAAGAGVDIPLARFTLFAEGRYQIRGGARLVPMTLGFRTR